MTWDVGATVAVRTLGNRKGSVIAAEGNGRYRVRVENVTLSCREEELSSAAASPKTRGARKRKGQDVEEPARSHPEQTGHGGPAARRLDLHGLSVEEALVRVDEEINRALLVGAERLEIVHGRGTGRIRDALHRHLASMHVVAAFRLDPANSGVTLVHF